MLRHNWLCGMRFFRRWRSPEKRDGLTSSDQEAARSPAACAREVPAHHYVVSGASVEAVNGLYKRQTDLDGFRTFANNRGILLCRSVSPDGVNCWSFSSKAGEHGPVEYYQCKTRSRKPPLEGYVPSSCAKVGSSPQLRMLVKSDSPDVSDDERCQEQSAVQSTKMLEDPIELVVLFMSGRLLAKVREDSSQTVLFLKLRLLPHLESGQHVATLMHDGNILEDTVLLGTLRGGSLVVQVVLATCDYMVNGAGSQVVNGAYRKRNSPMHGATCYENEAGIWLFRYAMSRTTCYWYLSDPRGHHSDLHPPLDGWSTDSCPRGKPPYPHLSCYEVR